jgi:hypothetical protein
MKGLTLALGAVVAATAVIYLNEGSVADEADLVAPRSQRAAVVDAPEKTMPEPPKAAGAIPSEQATSPTPDFVLRERDKEASIAKTNLFRALESPPVIQAAASPVETVAPAPVVTPKPNFTFLGSFKEGAELQAIIQVGEKVEFVQRNQIITGFRIDSVDSGALSWSHEPSATKGRLLARGVQ